MHRPLTRHYAYSRRRPVAGNDVNHSMFLPFCFQSRESNAPSSTSHTAWTDNADNERRLWKCYDNRVLLQKYKEAVWPCLRSGSRRYCIHCSVRISVAIVSQTEILWLWEVPLPGCTLHYLVLPPLDWSCSPYICATPPSEGCLYPKHNHSIAVHPWDVGTRYSWDCPRCRKAVCIWLHHSVLSK